MPRNKKVWSEEENSRLMKKHGKELGELGKKIYALIEKEGTALDSCPDLLAFYKKITLKKGDLEKMFALSCVLVVGMFIGKMMVDAENSDDKGDSGPPVSGGNRGKIWN